LTTLEIELITAARGPREGSVSVQAGLTAQAVTFGRALLDRSWEVSLAELTGGDMSGVRRVPTPAALAISEALTYRRRHLCRHDQMG